MITRDNLIEELYGRRILTMINEVKRNLFTKKEIINHFRYKYNNNRDTIVCRKIIFKE